MTAFMTEIAQHAALHSLTMLHLTVAYAEELVQQAVNRSVSLPKPIGHCLIHCTVDGELCSRYSESESFILCIKIWMKSLMMIRE